MEVSPRKGRWIEIAADTTALATLMFLPVRGDGLKFRILLWSFRLFPFLPVRGDGLKCDTLFYDESSQVSPRKGRWIEI